MTINVFDASTPPSKANRPKADACLAYFGGDTPTVWDAAQIEEQYPYKVIPTFVRSSPSNNQPTQAHADSMVMIARLHELKVPLGVLTLLDIETAVDPAYVAAYGVYLHRAHYKVAVYGSTDNLFKNPQLDGYWMASPGAKGIDPHCIATQYLWGSGFDMSWLDTTIPLWEGINPSPKPTPRPPSDLCAVRLPVLRVGSSGQSVRALQTLLVLRGHVVTVDGVFGPKTEKAVRLVENAAKIASTGVVKAGVWEHLIGR